MSTTDDVNDVLTDALECMVESDEAHQKAKEAMATARLKARKSFEAVRKAKRLLSPPKR